MTQYSTHKKNNDRWFSPPFYTQSGGYKLCIRVDANGNGGDTGTHVSVYVYLMRGEYDSALKWPFQGDITIQLVNSNSNQYHHEDTVYFRSTSAGKRVTSGERAVTGRGISQFISHAMVESSTDTKRYLNNDSLTFRVTKIINKSTPLVL